MVLPALLAATLELGAAFFVQSAGVQVKVSARQLSNTAAVQFQRGPKLLKRDEFRILSYEGAQGLAFMKIDEPGLPEGVIIFAVAHQVGADGINTESGLYRIHSGKVDTLWSKHRFLSFSREALCLGRLGRHGVGVAELRMDDASGCVTCDHLYFATVSKWRDGRLVTRKLGTTSQKHATGEAAAREFGIDCKDPMVTLLTRGAG